MYNPWYDAAVLAMESSGVVFLRTMTLALGGPGAEDESHRMVNEKVLAHFTAASTLMAGGSVQTVIAAYRRVVDDNTARLLKPSR